MPSFNTRRSQKSVKIRGWEGMSQSQEPEGASQTIGNNGKSILGDGAKQEEMIWEEEMKCHLPNKASFSLLYFYGLGVN